MARILLTGVTGVVGSAIAPLLRREGHQIYYLIRPKNGQAPYERLQAVIGELTDLDSVVIGDITDADSITCEPVDKIVHCAASVKFDESRRAEIYRTNLGGTRNMLELATRLGASEFHYVSSAYVAGDAKVFTENDVDIGQRTRNPYESSKLEAEKLVRNWTGGRFSIYRPSIVVGNGQTGEIKSFDGYYGFFTGFWRLLQKQKRNPEKYRRQGIKSSGGLLILPLQMRCSMISTLNLVTNDWVTEVLRRLIGLPAVGQTYHLVHPSPPRVHWVIEQSSRTLGISGFRYNSPAMSLSTRFLNRVQREVDRNLARYLPYINHEAQFDSQSLVSVLGDDCPRLPAIDQSFLTRMLGHACRVNFGHKGKEVETS